VTLRSILSSIPALVLAAQCAFAFAKLSPGTAAAFDRYVESAESRMNREPGADKFMEIDSRPDLKAKLRAGELHIESGASRNGGKSADVPNGMLQDWLGMMFIPNATIAQVRAVLQDYENYKNFYRPEVIESKLVSQHDDEYDISLRLYEKHILTVVLNTSYHVRYSAPDAGRLSVTSRSTRIAEVKNPARSYTEEEPVGNDTGFLWRLNSYWRFRQTDDGVYAQCEAISLSRDVPLGLGWMLKGFLERFPKESMLNTLRGTKAAVESRREARK
jgi:hypothetical protein